MATASLYPVQLSVDYPERPLNRLTTFFRSLTVIPIGIILALLAAGGVGYSYGVGFVIAPTLSE